MPTSTASGPGSPAPTFHHPDELAGEVAHAGVVLTHGVGVEGPLIHAGQSLIETLESRELTSALLELLWAVEDEPCLFGASRHLLSVAAHPRVERFANAAAPTG